VSRKIEIKARIASIASMLPAVVAIADDGPTELDESRLVEAAYVDLLATAVPATSATGTGATAAE